MSTKQPLPAPSASDAFGRAVAARLGLRLAFEDSNASPVWPPSTCSATSA